MQLYVLELLTTFKILVDTHLTCIHSYWRIASPTGRLSLLAQWIFTGMRSEHHKYMVE